MPVHNLSKKTHDTLTELKAMDNKIVKGKKYLRHPKARILLKDYQYENYLKKVGWLS